MKKTAQIVISCDIYIFWKHKPPRYRVWFEDQLLWERTFTWDLCYIEEHYTVLCPSVKLPGQTRDYQVKHELLDIEHSTINVVNWQVRSGAATVNQQGLLTVTQY